MKILNSIIGVSLLTLALAACNNTTKTFSSTQDSLSTVDSSSTASIAVNPLPHAKDFPGATLKIASLSAEKVGADSAKITIKYDVQNFKLTEQTEHSHHMANSHDGQHIHFILDNGPYTALYKPEHSVTVPLNSEHYLLSFLSRSFHESIKTADASKLIKFKINAEGKIENQDVPKEASLFYSRPKGEYKGDEVKAVLLDFFLQNTTIDKGGNKVKANINGQDFVLDQWTPYEILNLPLGENTVKLTLIDKDGNALTGDNVSVERKFTLK